MGNCRMVSDQPFSEQFFELVRNYHLFKRPGEYSDAVHLQSIAETLGPFPERFLKNCSRRNDFFDERGQCHLHLLSACWLTFRMPYVPKDPLCES